MKNQENNTIVNDVANEIEEKSSIEDSLLPKNEVKTNKEDLNKEKENQSENKGLNSQADEQEELKDVKKVKKETKSKKKKKESKAESIDKKMKESAFFQENVEKAKQVFQENQLNTQKQEENSFDKNKYFQEHNYLFLKTKEILTNPKVFNGLLIIGDPHVWSNCPGRRLDDCFYETICDKIEQSAEIANQYNLKPICLGDLFHHALDNNLMMITRLVNALKKFDEPMIVIEGNHDKNEFKINSKNPLFLLNEMGVVKVVNDNGFIEKVVIANDFNEKGYLDNLKEDESKNKILIKKDLNDNDSVIENKKEKIVLLGATPYGLPIPDNIVGFLKEKNVWQPLTEKQEEKIIEQEKANKSSGNVPIYLNQRKFTKKEEKDLKEFLEKEKINEVIWFTHHDLAMNGAYPNSIALKDILGVDKVINGHIHGTKEPVKVEKTIYYNPGNITRLSYDMLGHSPAVWVYSPFLDYIQPSITGEDVDALLPCYLRVEEGRDIFRLTGKHSDKNSISEKDILNYEQELGIDLTLSEEQEKLFVPLLQQQEDSTYKTADGVEIEDSLQKFLEENQVEDEYLATKIARLLRQVIENENSK